MITRHVLVAITAAVFCLAAVASVNDSETINVALPSQYHTVWDQAPFAVTAGEVAASEATEPRQTDRPDVSAEIDGPFARGVKNRFASRS